MFKLFKTVSLLVFLSSLSYTTVLSTPRAGSTEVKTCFNGEKYVNVPFQFYQIGYQVMFYIPMGHAFAKLIKIRFRFAQKVRRL